MPFRDEDNVTETKTIYQVSASEIMWRNFLAGMSRALGGMVIYFVVAFIVGQVFLTFIWPVLEPTFNNLNQTTNMLNQLNMLQQPRLK